MRLCTGYMSFFFFNDTATTEIYTLSLHDALPIWTIARTETNNEGQYSIRAEAGQVLQFSYIGTAMVERIVAADDVIRSEEHTSELQSRLHLVCRLLLEKKKTVRLPPH